LACGRRIEVADSWLLLGGRTALGTTLFPLSGADFGRNPGILPCLGPQVVVYRVPEGEVYEACWSLRGGEFLAAQ